MQWTFETKPLSFLAVVVVGGSSRQYLVACSQEIAGKVLACVAHPIP
jgi:hypothetical protein